jgi:tetratricopeptide (TPR) repeat protein
MHNYISYSDVDGSEFALKLAKCLAEGPPEIYPWLDKWNLISGFDYDDQFVEAIRTCESLIFVMTMDSVQSYSGCKKEWTRALKYKKWIIPLLVDPKAEQPYMLDPRQYVDFTVLSFNDGCTKLKNDLLWGRTPEGQLQFLKIRLMDAQRALLRAHKDEKARIEKEIQELIEEITRREKIILNPKTAEAQSWQSINARIEIERNPPQQKEIEKHVRFINPPPMMASHFQDRYVETGIVADFLNTDSLRLITLVGRGGIGKTAMTCRLLKSLEQSVLPDDRGTLGISGIVYLSEIGEHKVGYTNLYEDLCKLLPADEASKYEQIYKDGQRSIRSKVFSLLEQFQNEPVIILLDNLETLIDKKSSSLIPEDLRDALQAILEAPHHRVKVIMTTRIPPQDILLIQPERQRVLHLDEGLGSPYAENLLRALDSDGTLGLKEAPDPILNKIRENTRGFPRALEVFYGILAADRSTTLEELLSETQNTLPQLVVEKLVGEAFSRLDKNTQMVMQALAIYARPVPSVAVDFLLQPYLKNPDSSKMLNLLVNMHFVRREMGRYYLHPVDLAYALGLVPVASEGDDRTEQISFSQRTLRKRASEYFSQIRRPRNEWKKLSDIEPQLAEFELRCAAGDYETAFWLIEEIDDHYLRQWGHAGLVVEMRRQLLGKLSDPSELMNQTGLGGAYLNLGKSQKAIEHSRIALDLSAKTNNQISYAFNLNSSAVAYRRLGQLSKAIEMYNRSLKIDRDLKRPWSEAATLGNLAVACRFLGDLTRSIGLHEQSLAIYRSNRNTLHESWSLGILSGTLRYAGKLQKSIEYSTRAVQVASNEHDRYWEAYHLAELGSAYLDSGNLTLGEKNLKKALNIAHETMNGHFEAIWTVRLQVKELLFGNPQHALADFKRFSTHIDEEENYQYKVDYRLACAMAELRCEQLDAALDTIAPILQTEYQLFLPDILALHGIILLNQKKPKEAAVEFTATITLADRLLQQSDQFYTAVEAKGVAACGLAICDGKNTAQFITLAINSYRQARAIVSDPGVVKRALFFFDECAKVDEHGIISEVRKEVEGITQRNNG